MAEIRVYLEGLIREYEAAGFKVGLIVERDGFSEHVWFKGDRQGYCAFPLNHDMQRAAEQDADAVYRSHIAYMNRTPEDDA